MAPERLSRLQHRILTWLWHQEQRTRGAMAASYPELVQALAHEEADLCHSLATLEAKGLICLRHTTGGEAEALDLTPQGRQRAAQRTTQRAAKVLLSWEHGLARVGECLVWFQHIEAALSTCISAFTGGSRKVGEIITSEMSFRVKVAVYSALCHHALRVEKLPQDLQQLVARLHWAEQERNTIAHSRWDANEKAPETIRREKTSSHRGRFTTTVEHVTSEELEDLRNLFEGIVTDLFYLTATYIPRLRRRLGYRPLPEVKASPGSDPI
jgi:DNA-binding MarR family transcriptional regulator